MRGSGPAAPASDSGFVYVRVKGQPDVELVGPDGKSIRAMRGGVLQNDFPGQAEAYSVPPNTQIALKSPPRGEWRLRVREEAGRRLIVTVLRSLRNGLKVCDAADTVLIDQHASQSWNLSWSGPDTCWVRLIRSTPPAEAGPGNDR